MEEIVSAVSALLIQEGLEIKVVNEKIGIVQAATAPSHSIWTGANTQKVWQVNVMQDTISTPDDDPSIPRFVITAFAKEQSVSQNAFGSTTATSEKYFGDDTDEDEAWYWNVRRGIEAMCNATVRIVPLKS
jgi:hypothetical protein